MYWIGTENCTGICITRKHTHTHTRPQEQERNVSLFIKYMGHPPGPEMTLDGLLFLMRGWLKNNSLSIFLLSPILQKSSLNKPWVTSPHHQNRVWKAQLLLVLFRLSPFLSQGQCSLAKLSRGAAAAMEGNQLPCLF